MGDRILLIPSYPTSSKDTGIREKDIIDGNSTTSHHGGGNGTVLHMQNPENELNWGIHPQDYELPKAVKTRVDAEIQQANAFAITTALFAGILLSLVQLEVVEPATTPAWQALRFFTYTAISINLTGTTLALVLIKLCSDLEGIAQQIAMSDPSSLPARIAFNDAKIPRNLLLGHHELLEKFGMPSGYKLLDFGASIWIATGNLFTFTSITMWVWLAEEKTVAGPVMIGTVPALLGLVYAFALTKRRRMG